MIPTLALRSSLLGRHSLRPGAADLFDTLKGDNKTGRLQAAKVLLTRTAPPERRGWGSGHPPGVGNGRLIGACEAMAEKSRRLASSSTPGGDVAATTFGNPTWSARRASVVQSAHAWRPRDLKENNMRRTIVITTVFAALVAQPANAWGPDPKSYSEFMDVWNTVVNLAKYRAIPQQQRCFTGYCTSAYAVATDTISLSAEAITRNDGTNYSMVCAEYVGPRIRKCVTSAGYKDEERLNEVTKTWVPTNIISEGW